MVEVAWVVVEKVEAEWVAEAMGGAAAAVASAAAAAEGRRAHCRPRT